MKLKKCPVCKRYSLKENCPICKKENENAHYKYIKIKDLKKEFKKR